MRKMVEVHGRTTIQIPSMLIDICFRCSRIYWNGIYIYNQSIIKNIEKTNFPHFIATLYINMYKLKVRQKRIRM